MPWNLAKARPFDLPLESEPQMYDLILKKPIYPISELELITVYPRLYFLIVTNHTPRILMNSDNSIYYTISHFARSTY